MLLVALGRSTVTPFSSSWCCRFENRYTGDLQRPTLNHSDVHPPHKLRFSAVTSSPVGVDCSPDNKDGCHNSHQDNDCRPNTHQDQHQLLTLGFWGLESKTNTPVTRNRNRTTEGSGCTTTYLLTGVSKCVMGMEDPSGGPGLGLLPQGRTTVCSAS